MYFQSNIITSECSNFAAILTYDIIFVFHFFAQLRFICWCITIYHAPQIHKCWKYVRISCMELHALWHLDTCRVLDNSFFFFVFVIMTNSWTIAGTNIFTSPRQWQSSVRAQLMVSMVGKQCRIESPQIIQQSPTLSTGLNPRNKAFN